MDDSTAFPAHVFDALGADPLMHAEPIGGTIRVVEKRPSDGPIVMMTIGASLLPTDSGERVELAVETIEGQHGAAIIAMKIVCDDMAANRRVPPVAAPWRNSEPFLTGTRISAIMVTPSRWGDSFDEVRSAEGAVVGHVRMLRLLTDAEASFARVNGWEALVAAAGSVDALLDVTRADAVAGAGLPGDAPVFLSKMHADHPPRWVTFTGNDLESFTGLESDEYMEDAANREIWSYSSFSARYPWVEGFVNAARPGQTALFTDRSGAYALEDD
ncbi:suppressor of fused domain protein [Agrococcus sp. ARC_14]|uniref:suppressor of fused domain protein n=1 Tax=Agrococcus sp. ARC_14 TaxID=2919927 RepID=UPI001F054D6E|nr:suppressor of fused domain protein [Agrococcus sp. ARC_14]MCH1882525.1 suppressor of fused domain protein [Agrococcus sp. ARC_14]